MNPEKKLFIDGELVEAASGKTYPNISPVTEQVVGDAADLGRSRARRVHRVEAVDVEAEVGRAVADDTARFRDHAIDTELLARWRELPAGAVRPGSRREP